MYRFRKQLKLNVMKMNLIFLALVGGALVLVAEAQTTCDPNPCDHICIDNIDSYRCDCYQNWELQEDGHTCIHPRNEGYENMFYGCFAEDSENRDVEFYTWDRIDSEDASIENCVHDCRTQAFTFAALQKGGQCWCTNSVERIHGESTECTMACSGEKHQVCGGDSANSVYFVNPDKRYVGCFYEDVTAPDLGDLLWNKEVGNSPQQCIMACSDAGYDFAGVFDGGRCSCDNDYGSYGVAPANVCNVSCVAGWLEQNCGGVSTNGIYRIVRTNDISAAYTEPEVRAEFPARLMTDYPYTNGVIGTRFVMYASDVVHASYEDYDCYTTQCYSMCGDIFVPEGIDGNPTNVTIRQFHLTLSDVPAMIKSSAERVYVFAQTLVIDQSVNFEYAMYIRARQIIINYDVDPYVGFKHDGPEFDYDIIQAINRGPPSDITMLKLSTACGRMLLMSQHELDRRLGFAIFDDIARDYNYTEEHKTYQDAIRNIRTVYTSLERYGVNFAPYYTKSALERKLEKYNEKLSIYRDEFESMMDDVTDCTNFLARAGTMIDIWTDTIVTEASFIQRSTYDTLVISQAAYQEIYAEYNASVARTEEARVMFEEGIESATTGIIFRSMIGLCTTSYRMYKGIPPTDAKQTQADIIAASQELADALVGFAEAMENLAVAVENMQAMLAAVDAVMAGLEDLDAAFEWAQYDGAVEMVSTLYYVAEEWENIATMVDVTLRDPTFRSIDGCLEFRMAFVDTCRWGEALTRSAIENAENMRRAITATALYLNKRLMKERYDAYFQQVEADCNLTTQATVKWAEQNYDITIEMNHLLITFCQAYYYEEMINCPSSARPDFSLSIDELLIHTLTAINTVEGMGRDSSAVLDVDITDTDLAADCENPDTCPVNIFRNNRNFTYTTPIDHPTFFEIDLLLVEELRVYFHGAKTTMPEEESKQSVQIYIESSGPFINRRDGRNEYFVTRAMSERTYGYNLVTDVIELYCDLYEPQGSKVQHMTPFTTWMIRLTDSPNMDHVDLSEVNKITITFMGSFLQGYKDDGSNKIE